MKKYIRLFIIIFSALFSSQVFANGSESASNTDQFQPMNLPITYTTPDNLPTVGAPETEVQQPSFGLTLSAAAYVATHNSNPTESDAVNRMQAAREIEAASGYDFGLIFMVIFVIALLLISYLLTKFHNKNKSIIK